MKDETKKKITTSLKMMDSFTDEVLGDFRRNPMVLKSPIEEEDRAVRKIRKDTDSAYNIHREHCKKCAICQYRDEELKELRQFKADIME